jgi:hypothetical protein
MFWASFADPNLSLTLVDVGGEDPVAIGADTAGLTDLFSLGPFDLNSFQI